MVTKPAIKTSLHFRRVQQVAGSIVSALKAILPQENEIGLLSQNLTKSFGEDLWLFSRQFVSKTWAMAQHSEV